MAGATGWLSLTAICGGAFGGVEVTWAPDGSVRVSAAGYTASLDREGNFVALSIGGREILDPAKKGGNFPGGPAGSVEVRGTLVCAERGGVRVEIRFDDAGFELSTRGGTVEWWLGSAVNACLARDGQAAARTDAMGDVQKVVAGTVALGLSKPYHLLHGRLWPSHLCGRGGKPEDPFTCRFDCGVPFEPVELLALVSLEAEGAPRPPAVPTFPAGQTPRVRLSVRNLGETEAKGDVRFRVLDHPVKPRTVLEKVLSAAVPPAQAASLPLDVPLPTPGLYWVHAEMIREGKPFKQIQLGLLYDPDRYRPPLTRPPDFREFWDRQLRELRAIPFDAKLAEAPDRGNERFVHYDLELAGVRGKRLRTFLRVPRRPGPHDAEVISHWGSDTPEKVLAHLQGLEKQPSGAGMWQRGADRIRVGAPQPEDSTYTRWAGREDNNMLESYLLNVRMADYLRSRPDVARLWMFGSSRSGASILAAAALSPERVAAVNAHVPTCCGLSWTDRPYAGWGRPPAPTPEGLRTAAYFDVTNFAPDLSVPVIVDGGFYDGLSPAPGILALHNGAEKAPFRRCLLYLGGHGFFPPERRRQAEAELEEFLRRKDGS